MEMVYYPQELTLLVNTLDDYEKRNPGLSLFHQGIERLRLLEDVAVEVGLSF